MTTVEHLLAAWSSDTTVAAMQADGGAADNPIRRELAVHVRAVRGTLQEDQMNASGQSRVSRPPLSPLVAVATRPHSRLASTARVSLLRRRQTGQSPGPVEPSQRPPSDNRQQSQSPCSERSCAVKNITYSPLGPGTTSGSWLKTSYTTEYRVEVLHPHNDAAHATRGLILSFRDSDVYQSAKLPYWLLYNAYLLRPKTGRPIPI